RRARAGEKLEFIDGRERELSPEVLVIADRDSVVGAAGIMGGKGSEITDDTTAIALEAACFNPARVRRGSRLLGLSSDSSVRFERGVDIAGVKRAARRAIELVMKYGNVHGGGGFFQAGDDTPRNVSIELRLAQIKRIAELDLDAGTCRDLLTPLGFTVEKEDRSQGTIQVKVPSFRQDDVKREIDLVEEVLRLKGYDSVPVSMPATTVSPPVNDSLPGRARRALAAQGLCEAWISSLRSERELEGAAPRSILRVLNPLSKDHQVLRQSLIPGLIEAAAYNFDRGNRDVWLFELGRGYEKSGSADDSAGVTGVTEKELVAGVITGSNIVQVTEGSQESGSSPAMSEKVDFYRAKGIVENLLQDVGVPSRRLRYFRPAEVPEIFHPYRACQIALAPAGDSKARLEILGWIGEIHPKILNELGLRQEVGVFELNLDSVRQGAQKAQFTEPASTPSMTRDLTADLPREVDSQAVASCIESAAGQRLIDLQLVSVFHLSEGVRSLSYRMTFQDAQKTLTAEEIDKSINRIRNSLTHQLGANFRA
ncbi:MAG: phenylalanine--tRNA ligase subunit beta, partial [Cyanobacteria bacterium HKST-UBA02]|nr:phenylalanine--tRNA ligase subunit beta [Cyanobacteria bacterium HKST-UBA02]